MQERIQEQLLGALFSALKPLAKILLRYGIGFREFAEISKAAFVEVATQEYGIRGRPTNISRVAVMTGLTRKEVRRIRDKIKEERVTEVLKTTPMREVLERWHSDKDFLSEEGEPADLPFNGEGISFAELVRRFGGDIPPGAMRTELKRVGAVEDSDEGKLRVVKQSIYRNESTEAIVNALRYNIYAALENVAHNTDPEPQGADWNQKFIFSRQVSRKDGPRLRRAITERADEFSNSINQLLGVYHEMAEDTGEDEKDKETIAVGLYFFEKANDRIHDDWSTDATRIDGHSLVAERTKEKRT